MEGTFTLFAIDSDNFLDAMEPTVDCLRFDDLSWGDVVALSEQCFRQGFPVVVWRQGDAQAEG